MKCVKEQYRQGDVLIERDLRVPANSKPAPRDGGRIVLAYGEVTGHAHAIAETTVEAFEDPSGTLWLKVPAKGAHVVHEEHATIDLPPGTYRVGRQREYSPEAIRNVAD